MTFATVMVEQSLNCAVCGGATRTKLLSGAIVEQRLYESTARRITSMIEGGTLRVGDRVPSVRHFSVQQKVSVSTVLQAYRALEDAGWIEARPQSGYYVRRTARTLPPEPEMSQPSLEPMSVAVSDLVMQFYRAAQRPDIVQMGAAIGDTASFPSRQLNRAVSKVMRECRDAGNAYDFPPGNHQLRVQIAKRAMETGCALTPDDIVITTGCTEALNLCLRAVAKPGDTILLESPTYYSALQIIESLGLCALEVPTHPRDGISLEALEYVLEHEKIAACLLMPSLNNPLGSCMPAENRKRLVQLLAQREIPLIEDDVWGDTLFHAPRLPVAKSYDENGLVLLCSSFSKTIAPGYRVGWVAPGRFRQQIEYLKLVGSMANPSLPSLAIAELLENGGYDHHLRTIRRTTSERVQRTVELLEEYFPEGTRVTRPCGGTVVWIELPSLVDTTHLFQTALREGICIAPGAMFSGKGKYNNCLRLYCGHHDSATTERTIQKLAQLIDRL
ncbi:MAG TPA: PLP-dependent aminotransferase family protein [Abditibacteriaceae bacterium]|jgi:DNA-binding transcriptional MocR family regulator